MALYQSIVENGQKLFKYRSFIPLVFYPIAALAIFMEPGALLNIPDLPLSIVCIAISLFGLVIRSLVIGYVPAGTSGRNTEEQKASFLNQTGIYSTVRHPLYFGNLFMWLGIMLYVGHIWFAVVAILLFWVYYERIMLTEEHFLKQKFNEEYEKWAEHTPAFFPKFSKWTKPSLSFCFPKVIRREYRGLVAVILSMALIHFFKNLALYGEYKLNEFWTVALIISIALFIFIRILKKATHLLDAPGR